MTETVARRALWTLVVALSVTLDHAAWMIFSDKDMCVRLQTQVCGTIHFENTNNLFFDNT